MKSKSKTVGAVGIVVAAIGAAVVITTPPQEKTPKAGYALEHQSNGKYSVYEIKDGKKTKMGEDLTTEQADEFTDKKKGRHKKQ